MWFKKGPQSLQHYISGDGGEHKRQSGARKQQDKQLSAVITMLECADRLADRDFICSLTQGHDGRKAILR